VSEGELKRELGLRDITLFAITCITGTRWIAAAAHAGPGSLTLWFLAAMCFVIPMAVTLGGLSARHPSTGGLYVWIRSDFGRWHGFLAFWVYWMGLAIWFPSATMFYTGAALHALGLPETRPYVLTASLGAIWLALGSNLVGMKIGKWTENIGGFAVWTVSLLLAALAVLVWMKRGSATAIDPLPHFDWGTVNFWATIAYAMSGLEMIGLMGGEVRDPTRTIPRAGWIASACITAFYIACTIALLVILPAKEISELSGLSQAGDEAARMLGIASLGSLIALLVVASGMGQLGGIGTSISRLPFVVGADRLLPAVFSRVHPRWGTPYAAILVLGCFASFLLIAIQLGDTMRAAYQALVSLSVIVGFLPYLYLFGCGWKAGARVSAISGGAVTAIAILCAIVPSAEISNVWLFEGKLAAGTLAVIATAWLVYRRKW
jgi:glutamate:GABA antiporter